MYKTDLHSSLLFLMLKLEEAKSNPMLDKNFIAALTEVLRYFCDNGELKKAYEIDAELPDIDSLIKKLTSDEYIEKKIKDVLGE